MSQEDGEEPRDAVPGEAVPGDGEPIQDAVPGSAAEAGSAAVPSRGSGSGGWVVGVLVLLGAVVGIPVAISLLGDAIERQVNPPVTYASTCLEAPGVGVDAAQTGVVTLDVPAGSSPPSDTGVAIDFSAPDSQVYYLGFGGYLDSYLCGLARVRGPVSRAGCEAALAASHPPTVNAKVGDWFCGAAMDRQPVLFHVTALSATSVTLGYTEWE